ncbi:molybdate ABC transporter substrate-binding protein [Candidatus Electrothrix sp.]|uniref:molybdate ABC transporter substrate-binding protein n=1 Tax=Candidatus Electrothrix sp. TaxID=2170559 RepID=UPI004057A65B
MKLKVLIIILVVHFFAATASAETVNLSAAASMTDALKEIITGFAAAHPAARIRPNFASSGSLAKQIDQGAPADVYISANPKWMKYLVGKELIAPGTDRIFAYNKLVFVGEKRSRSLALDKLTELDRIALGSPQSVPAGQYAKQALEHAKIYTVLAQQRKLVMAKDVRQALLYADRGEVDGAFVYQTDALLARNAKILFIVPDDSYDQVAYPLGLTVAGAKNASAKALYEYMSSTEAKQVLKKYGFEMGK